MSKTNRKMYDSYVKNDTDYFNLQSDVDECETISFNEDNPNDNEPANVINGYQKIYISEPFKTTPVRLHKSKEKLNVLNDTTQFKEELSFNNYFKKYENFLKKDDYRLFVADATSGYIIKEVNGYRGCYSGYIESLEKYFEKFCITSIYSISYKKAEPKDKLKFIFDLCEYFSVSNRRIDFLFYENRTYCRFISFYNNLWVKLRYICDLLYDDYYQIYTPMIKRIIDIILKEDSLENIFANFVEIFENNDFNKFIKDFELVNKVSNPLFERNVKEVEELVEKVVKEKVSYPGTNSFEYRLLNTYFDRIIKGDVDNICNPNFNKTKSLLEIYYSCFSECHLKNYKIYDGYVVKQLHKLYALFNQNKLSLFIDKADNTIHRDYFSEFYIKNIDMKTIRDFILRFCNIDGENNYRFKTIPSDEFSVISYEIINNYGFKELVKNIDDFIYVYEKRCFYLKECEKAYKKIMETNLCSYVENDKKLVEVTMSLKEVKQKFSIISVETIDEIINKEVNGLLEYVYSLEEEAIENTFSLLL